MMGPGMKRLWMTAARAIVAALPRPAFELVRRAELACQLLQGKGLTTTIANQVRAVVPLLPPAGAVVLDVGAHRGAWGRTLLELAGDRVGWLVAFEPAGGLGPGLEGVPRTRWVRAAVGDREGTAVLHHMSAEGSLASLHRRRLDHLGLPGSVAAAETVPVTTLDAFVAREGLTRVDLVKMDVEGHELAVLRGAEGLLRARAVGAIAFEFGDAALDAGTRFRDLWDLLTAHGFHIGRVVPPGRLLPIRRYTADLETFAETNYVAVRGGASGPAAG